MFCCDGCAGCPFACQARRGVQDLVSPSERVAIRIGVLDLENGAKILAPNLLVLNLSEVAAPLEFQDGAQFGIEEIRMVNLDAFHRGFLQVP